MKGKLVRWNEDRGFGFITSTSAKGDVFIHISELKNMARKPKVGDTIFFDLVTEKNGKNKAINASIEGVAKKTIKRPKTRRKNRKNRSSGVILLIIVLAVSFAAYRTYPKWSPRVVESLPVNFVKEDFSGFRCEGKQYCSQMTSCKEARFYLKNCPNVKIDGNNDGIPCEKQWCN
ncbi:MAG: cold shock domain-containing protein [Bacteroidetes bacterium]|nr:cold shock domain-containing protein [Bacteroidota bacterium]